MSLLLLLACEDLEPHPPHFESVSLNCLNEVWRFQALVYDPDGLDDVDLVEVEAEATSGATGSGRLFYLWDGRWEAELDGFDFGLYCADRAGGTFTFTATDTDGGTDVVAR